jgi:hypothetical protein
MPMSPLETSATLAPLRAFSIASNARSRSCVNGGVWISLPASQGSIQRKYSS